MYNPVFVRGRDLNDAYFSLLWEIHKHGRKYLITSGSFAGAYRLEFDWCGGFIDNPHVRPLAPIMPPGIAPVTTDEVIENDYFPNYLMNPELSENEHYKYAQWINGTDYYSENKHIPGTPNMLTPYKTIVEADKIQFLVENKETPIEWVIRHFKEKGWGNNHCYINVGNSDSNFNYDLPYSNESDRKTSPCLRGIDFKIKDGKLITTVVFRSWDLYAGFPENMGGFTLLNEYVASEIGCNPGPLAWTSAGLHLYDYQIKPVLAILNKD